MYDVHSVLCTLCTVQYTVFNVLCTMYMVYSVYCIQCILYGALVIVFAIHEILATQSNLIVISTVVMVTQLQHMLNTLHYFPPPEYRIILPDHPHVPQSPPS